MKPATTTRPSKPRGFQRRRALISCITAMILALATACAPRNNVTLEEYKAQTEELGETLLATIDGVERKQDDAIRSIDSTGELDTNSTWRYWHWTGDSTFPGDSEVRASEGARRMGAVLAEDGWTVGSLFADEPTPSDTEGSFEYRRPGPEDTNGWYVKLYFKEHSDFQRLSITIVSPSTDARDGTLDAAREFEDVATRVEALLATKEEQLNQQRLHYFLGAVPSGKTPYLSALRRWQTAAAEVRDFITTVREATGNHQTGDQR